MPTLRDRRRRELRADIAAHALRLFAADGFDQVSVERVAEAAGISRRTFFTHFASKEDVVAHGANDDLRFLADGLEAHAEQAGQAGQDGQAGGGFAAALRASAPAWVAGAGEHAERRALRARIESMQPRVRAAVREQRFAGLYEVALPHIAADLRRPADDPLVAMATGAFAGLGLAIDDVMQEGRVDAAGAVEDGIVALAGMLDAVRALPA